MFKKIMKKLLSILSCLIITMSLVACNSEPQPVESALQVNYIGISNGSMSCFVDDFRSQYPDKKIKWVDMNPYKDGKRIGLEAVNETKMAAELMAGRGPDMIICQSGTAPFTDLYKVVQSGAFEPLDSYIEQDKDFNYDNYYKVTFEAGKYDGKLYVMPYSFSLPIYISSQEYLIENNIMYQGWDNLVDMTNVMTKFIEKKSEMHFIDAFSFIFRDSFFYSASDIINPAADVINIDSDKCRQLLQAAKLLYQTEKPFDVDNIGKLTVGNTIFTYAPNILWGLSKAFELDALGLQQVVIPIKDDGKIHANIDIGMMISKNSTNKQDAYNFMRIMMEHDDCFDQGGNWSVNRNNFDYMVGQQNHYDEVTNLKDSDKFIDQYKDILDDIDSCGLGGGMYKQFIDYFTPYFNDEKPLDECIKTAQSAMEIYISE